MAGQTPAEPSSPAFAPGSPLLAPLSGRPPLLPSTNLFGHLFRFRNDPLTLLEDGRALGDTVRMRIGGRYLIMVFNAEAVHHVLVENQPNFVT